MNIRPIKTSDDHKQALLRIDALMDAEPGTEEGAELDVLVTLVEAFEKLREGLNIPFENLMGTT